MAMMEEPIISRMDRLDNMLKQLELIRGGSRSSAKSSSGASTPSSGMLTASDGHTSSTDFSPHSLEKHCRPIDHVVMETEVKGTLIERLHVAEARLHKMEEELEAERKRECMTEKAGDHHKRGLKHMLKSLAMCGGSHAKAATS